MRVLHLHRGPAVQNTPETGNLAIESSPQRALQSFNLEPRPPVEMPRVQSLPHIPEVCSRNSSVRFLMVHPALREDLWVPCSPSVKSGSIKALETEF